MNQKFYIVVGQVYVWMAVAFWEDGRKTGTAMGKSEVDVLRRINVPDGVLPDIRKRDDPDPRFQAALTKTLEQ